MRNFTERLLQFRPNFKSRVSHSFTFTDCNTGHGDLDLLSQKRCPCTRLKDSTPKINRQMEVAFGTRLADDWLRAALNPGLASGCIIPSVCLHKSSSPQEIQAQESAGHAFILGPKFQPTMASQMASQPTSRKCPAACKDASNEVYPT